MLQDNNQHMFCEACLIEASEKHHRVDIYCKYEKKQVGIFEMYEANDLIRVIRDQYVLCPNKKCGTAVTLNQLKEHFTQCQTTVTCSTCDRQVETAEWDKHNKDCKKRGACETQSKGMKEQVQPNYYGLSSPGQSRSARVDSNRNNGDTLNSIYPSGQLQQAQIPTNEGAHKTTHCPHCQRKVKEINLEPHVNTCSKAPQPCVYCEKGFTKEEMTSHKAVCVSNPDNILAHKRGKDRKAPNTQVESPHQAPAGKKTSYAGAVRTGLPADSNGSTGASPRPAVHSHSSEAQRVQSQPRASYNVHEAHEVGARAHFRDENTGKDGCCSPIAWCCFWWH